MTEDIPWQIKVELIAEPSISATADWATKVDVAAITITGLCWMDPIIEFLTKEIGRASCRERVLLPV